MTKRPQWHKYHQDPLDRNWVIASWMPCRHFFAVFQDQCLNLKVWQTITTCANAIGEGRANPHLWKRSRINQIATRSSDQQCRATMPYRVYHHVVKPGTQLVPPKAALRKLILLAPHLPWLHLSQCHPRPVMTNTINPGNSRLGSKSWEPTMDSFRRSLCGLEDIAWSTVCSSNNSMATMGSESAELNEWV